MPNDLSDKVIMCSVIALIAWAIIGLPAIQYIPASWFKHPSEWLVAIFTLLLVVVAFVQWRTTKILERAYLSAEPAGINPFRSLQQMAGHEVLGHVDFYNAGRQPAQGISYCVKIMQSGSGAEPITSFPIEEKDFSGTFVLPRWRQDETRKRFHSSYTGRLHLCLGACQIPRRLGKATFH